MTTQQLEMFNGAKMPPQVAVLDHFLKSLQGFGKSRYKRYAGLPLRYAGGKSLAVGQILEHLPMNTPRIMSPFVGGGSVEIACARELGIEVQAYDIFDILVVFWQSILSNPEKLADTIGKWEPTKEQYKIVKERLKAHWKDEERITNKNMLAAHYWFNHNLSYGPGFLGWMSSIHECPKKFGRLLEKVRAFDCPTMKVGVGSFDKTIPRHADDFLYCDPPYYLEDGKMFKGIYPQRNFPIHHNGFDHFKLNELLKNHKGGFILSYNDCDTIRDLYSDYDIYDVSWQYTMGQGETRIGKNRIENNDTHVKQSHEILIVNNNL